MNKKIEDNYNFIKIYCQFFLKKISLINLLHNRFLFSIKISELMEILLNQNFLKKC